MDIRNRMADVIKMRSNVCQDFLCLVIKPNWKNNLYDIAKSNVSIPSLRSKYINAYEKMRDYGIDAFKISDMDVTFITMLVNYCENIVEVSNNTKQALHVVNKDRNISSHSNDNEKEEELYLRALIALLNLKDFVRVVDEEETTIKDEERSNFRKKYIPQIDSLMEQLDDERIVLVQKRKEIVRDITEVINSDNPTHAWWIKWDEYDKRYRKKDFDNYARFIRIASDYGIEDAHMMAATFCLGQEKADPVDYSKRIIKALKAWETKKELNREKVNEILSSINRYIEKHTKAKEIEDIIKQIRDIGYDVEEDKERYCLL